MAAGRTSPGPMPARTPRPASARASVGSPRRMFSFVAARPVSTARPSRNRTAEEHRLGAERDRGERWPADVAVERLRRRAAHPAGGTRVATGRSGQIRAGPTTRSGSAATGWNSVRSRPRCGGSRRCMTRSSSPCPPAGGELELPAAVSDSGCVADRLSVADGLFAALGDRLYAAPGGRLSPYLMPRRITRPGTTPAHRLRQGRPPGTVYPTGPPGLAVRARGP